MLSLGLSTFSIEMQHFSLTLQDKEQPEYKSATALKYNNKSTLCRLKSRFQSPNEL